MPYAQKLVESEKGSKIDLILKEIEHFLTVMLSLPYKTETLLQKIEQGKLEVRNPELEMGVEQLNRGLNKIAAAIIFGVLTWAAVNLMLNLMTIPGYILGGAAIITLGWVIFGN